MDMDPIWLMLFEYFQLPQIGRIATMISSKIQVHNLGQRETLEEEETFKTIFFFFKSWFGMLHHV